MKIGILTASRTDNNGTDLQSLAMYNMFKKLGANEIEIINYISDSIYCEINSKLSLRSILRYPVTRYVHKAHANFRSHYFHRSSVVYNKDTLENANYDIIVVGSDQVWNLDLTHGDTFFFLPFNNGARKFSYAVSLGTANVYDWEYKYKISKYLSQFENISIREESGARALNKINITSRYDLDPILMGSTYDWIHFTTPPKHKKKYIFLYLVEISDIAIKYAKIEARRLGCKIIANNASIRPIRGVNNLRFVGVEDWLNLVANAEMVITNSYHGLSFSILYKKDFRLCLLPGKSKNNERMLNLLERLSLYDHILFDIDNKYKEIDWNKVDDVPNRLRASSENYIREIIG